MIEEAVMYYNFNTAVTKLLRHNENMTYKIIKDDSSYLLRIHKPIEGFNLDFLRMGASPYKQIEDEMNILEYLNENSAIGTQKVIKNIYGNSVTILKDGTPVTVLGWIDGITLDNIEITSQVAFNIGTMLGDVHHKLNSLKLKNRYNYNDKLLHKMIGECDTALESGHFNNRQTKIIKDTLDYSMKFFIKYNDKPILTHSDLGKSNLLFNNGKIIPIDFSLSGYSIAEMDLASVFSHINNESLNNEILNGYRSVNDNIINAKAIDVCFCLQILLFVICQHNKVAGECWFSEKLDEWCERQFIPLISDKQIFIDTGLYI
ncbi:MAG: phosphotransferase enzyme family protein [Eubacteriales bacterium]